MNQKSISASISMSSRASLSVQSQKNVAKKSNYKQCLKITVYRVTTSGISGNLKMSGNNAKVREESWKRHKVREKSGNLCSQGYLIVASWHNACDGHGHLLSQNIMEVNLPELTITYLYFIATIL